MGVKGRIDSISSFTTLSAMNKFLARRLLRWGYVDRPPLAPLLLAMTRLLLVDSLIAIRLLRV
jgi:hypothetical protein